MSYVISDRQKELLKKVDDTCRSIRQYEEKCYLEEKLNEKVIPEFGKIGMLGCTISRKYGGLGHILFADQDRNRTNVVIDVIFTASLPCFLLCCKTYKSHLL